MNVVFQVVVENLLQDVHFTLHGRNESKLSIATRSTIRLAVSMVTTARQFISLSVAYGNNNTKHYSLMSQNGSMIGGETETEKDIDFIHVTSSYGESCQLQVELDHKYLKEGDYQPELTASNTKTNQSD